MNKTTLFLVTGVLIPGLLATAQTTQTKRSFFSLKRQKTQQVEQKKESDYEKLFKPKHLSVHGMIDLHLVGGKVYFEMPLSLMNREMLIGSTVTKTSDNGHAVVGSKPFNPLHVKFTKNDTHVQFRLVDMGYLPEDTNAEKALALSKMSAIIDNKKILAYNPDSTAVVFDMTDFFVGDNKRISPFDPYAGYSGYRLSKTFNAIGSYISGIKAFEDNVSISSVLSYTYSLANRQGQTLVKDEPFTTEMTRSIILLKEKPYRPRLADYRIGVFFTGYNKLADDLKSSSPVYYANRWDIQPKDSAAYMRGELVEPVKPIVFYIDDTFPEEWKPFIREGVSQWNEPFEAIGFKNVIIARDFPKDDPEFDPDNIKYSCVRYAPTNIQNAMGPSWIDPRSGEILMASVYIYHDVIKLVSNWLLTQTSQTDPLVRTLSIPIERMGDAIRYVVAHEIGHCLGFMHNMGASHTVPVDSLRSASYTQVNGTTPSIMDYARFNYVAQPGDMERGVKLTPPRFGEYDRYLVRWTYTPVLDARSPEEEERITSRWITDAVRSNPVYRYGKQQFRSTIDPRSQAEDLGDDVIHATRYGIQNLKFIAANVDSWIVRDRPDADQYQFVFNGILGQLIRYVSHVSGNVGGSEINEVKHDDKMPRFAPLSADYQRKALRYLFEMYGDLDWLDTAPIRARITISGSPADAVRRMIARSIMPLPFVVSIYEGMTPTSFKSREAFDMIYDFVWTPAQAATRLTEPQKILQETFVTQLLSMGKFTGGGAQRSLADEHDPFGLDHICMHPQCSADRATYGEVSGFEFEPDNRFATAKISQADIYAYLQRAKALARSRAASTTGAVRAHYQVLSRTIENALK